MPLNRETNQTSYNSKCYACVVLSDSEVTVFRERENTGLCPFFYCVLFIDIVA